MQNDSTTWSSWMWEDYIFEGSFWKFERIAQGDRDRRYIYN